MKNLIVSLTSYSPRFKFLNRVFAQINNQTLQPDKIVINIDIEEKEVFSKYADYLSKYPRLEVNYVEDLGPGKKLIPTLLKYPNSCIITIDDDLKLKKSLFSELWIKHLENPHSIIATRTHSPRTLDCGYLAPYKNWMTDLTSSLEEITPLVTAGSGALFPPNSLHPNVTNYEEFKEYCFSTDDIWYWFHALLKGSQITKINNFDNLEYLKDSQSETLYWDGNAGFFNDFNIQNMALHGGMFPCKAGCHPGDMKRLLLFICQTNSHEYLVGKVLPLTVDLSNHERYILIRDISKAEKAMKKEKNLIKSNRKLLGLLMRNIFSGKR
jgi:hypothetical protein